MFEHNLEQCVPFPTRGKNQLDLFFTNNPTRISSVKAIPGVSDHDTMVQISYNLSPNIRKKIKRKVFIYKRAKWQDMKTNLMKFTTEYMSSTPNSRSVDENWLKIKGKIIELMNQHIPSKMTSTRYHLPWLTTNTKRAIRKKQRLYNQAKSSKNQHLWTKFREFRKKVNKYINNDHWNYINNIVAPSLHSNNTKPFWSYIKNLKKDADGIQTLTDNTGRPTNTSDKKADILNKQFQSVFTKENLTTMPTKGPSPHPEVPPLNITHEGVTKLLKGLNARKATGPDTVPAMILKELSEELTPIICHLFNQSIATGSVPSDWRTAHIVPIFKKGDKTNPANYRPVSLTCILSKAMEHIISSHIMNHLETNNILSDVQHGFRAHRSCESQLLLTFNDWATNLDNKEQSDVIILDFSKAFDKVPHKRLQEKMSHYGINSNINTWIMNFLSNRQQAVLLEGAKSSYEPVTSGVPQGTVLGPILFLIYINDLSDNIKSKVRLFADDAVLYRNIREANDTLRLQEDLNTLCKWEEQWQMHFNPSKCVVLRVPGNRTPIKAKYSIHDETLLEVNNYKYLGVTINNKLKWDDHINNITKKTSSKLGFIQRNLARCSKNIKESAYNTLVRPNLEYCSSVWDPHNKSLKAKLERIQRKAARFVSKDFRRTSSVTTMLQNLNWPTLETRRQVSSLTMVHRILNNNIAINPDSMFTMNSTNTRKQHHLSIRQQYARTEVLKSSFRHAVVSQWNHLPSEIINISDTARFRSTLEPHLTSKN